MYTQQIASEAEISVYIGIIFGGVGIFGRYVCKYGANS